MSRKHKTSDHGTSRIGAPGRLRSEWESSLDKIVSKYVSLIRPCAQREVRFYANQPTLDDAIRVAALARTEDDKRHSHQCRRSEDVLWEAERRLSSAKQLLKACRSFDELHELVSIQIGPIHDIGPLTVYDTAHRIGAFLGLEPEFVYLHRGTRDGARTLGIAQKGRQKIHPDELPAPFRKLRPYEIEDCLCIFKDVLAKIGPIPTRS